MVRELCNRLIAWALAAVAYAVIAGLASSRAVAQGCAMCYQTAAASAAPGREALRHGILILLVPAASLFLGILWFIYRRRNLARSAIFEISVRRLGPSTPYYISFRLAYEISDFYFLILR